MSSDKVTFLSGEAADHHLKLQVEERRRQQLRYAMYGLVALGIVGELAMLVWMPRWLIQAYTEACLAGGQLKHCGNSYPLVGIQTVLLLMTTVGLIAVVHTACNVQRLSIGLERDSVSSKFHTEVRIESCRRFRLLALIMAFASLLLLLTVSGTAALMLY